MNHNEIPLVVGLTGQSGAGKTLVSRMLQERDLAVINADQVARDVVEKGKKCLLDLAVLFGVGILTPEGELNRKALAKAVFNNAEKLKLLNKTIFPYITQEIDDRMKQLRQARESIVILDAPTLFESGYDKKCQIIVSVLANRDERLHRIVMRDKISYEEAESRLKSQHDDAYYSSRSDRVIVNNNSLEDLKMQVVELMAFLEAERDGAGR